MSSWRPAHDRPRADALRAGSPNTINDHLDAWWAKLGSRLRYLPGHEFPQLPERVAQALQHLWNEALDGAQAVLRDTLSQGEQTLAQQEQALQTRERELTERERSCAARAATLEESLALAREQSAAANGRANGIERSLQEREGECGRLRARIESLETNVSELRAKLDAAPAAHHTERSQLQERYTAAESRWLVEVETALRARDRAYPSVLLKISGKLSLIPFGRNDSKNDLHGNFGSALSDGIDASNQEIKATPNMLCTGRAHVALIARASGADAAAAVNVATQ